MPISTKVVGRGSPTRLPAVRRPCLAASTARALLDAVGALEAHRGRPHAVRADRPLAALAPDPGLPVRCGGSRPARLARDAPAPDGAVVGGRGHPRSISTDSMTTGSTGRSPRTGRRSWRSRRRRRGWPGRPPRRRSCAWRFRCRRRLDGDEELRAVGARAGVGHRQQVGLGEAQLGVELVGEGVARAAGAGAQRAAALDHEPVDHPVEAQPVVVPLAGATRVVAVVLGALGQAREVLHGLGCVVREQVDARCRHGWSSAWPCRSDMDAFRELWVRQRSSHDAAKAP